VEGPLRLGPLTAAHEPPAAGAAAFTLAGHWHPAVALGSQAGDRLRRPCFVRYPHALVLPAFGGLTGAMTLNRHQLAREGADVAVLGEGDVHWLPGGAASRKVLHRPLHRGTMKAVFSYSPTAMDLAPSDATPQPHRIATGAVFRTSPGHPQPSLDGMTPDTSRYEPALILNEAPAQGYTLFFAVFPEPCDTERLHTAAGPIVSAHQLRNARQSADRLHVTLCTVYKGTEGVPHALIDAAIAAASGVDAPALSLRLDRAASFADGGAFVLQGDAATNTAVARLRRPLAAAARRFGMRPVESSTPHLSLVYRCGQEVAPHDVEPLLWTARRFALVLSHVGRTRHEWLAAWPLPSH
jgi:hypothetical protein